MNPKLIIPALLLFLISCGPVVTFDHPQPEGVDSLTAMPKKLTGTYISNDGTSKLVIDHQSMIIRSDYEVKQPRDSVDWDNLTAEDKKHYRMEGDWIIEHVADADTLFLFSSGNIMKKYKGYYILNSRLEDESWYVQKVELHKGMLMIGSISTKEELETLEQINESPIDTVTYHISFNKKQFRNYLKSGFSDVDTFKRVRKIL